MQVFLSRFWSARGGATAIEYAMIAGAIAVVIAAAVGFIGQSLIGIFQQVNNAFPAA